MRIWRDRVGQNGDNISNRRDSVDTAGFCLAMLKMASYADKPYTLERVSINTDQKGKTYYRSNAFWQCSVSVNLPAAIGNTHYSGINGFDARCCVYSVGLTIM